MEEIKVEVALEIIERKIINFIKNNKEKDLEKFKQKLSILVEERDKIYELDEDIINKVYDVYLEEIKNVKEN